MKAGDRYFVRIDRKTGGHKVDAKTLSAHMEHIRKFAAQAELYGGGFAGIPGGMLIFRADSFAAAVSFCKNDPVISGGFYRYELLEWELLVAPAER
ncbi:MAG: YciI family protein [Elusimicrobiales bacterium]